MVLITGAKGFLGKNVSLYFHEQGHKVIGLGHGNWKKNEYLNWGLSYWKNCSITLSNLRSYGGSPDIIVHCAGSGSVNDSFENPMESFNNSVGSLMAVLEFIRFSSTKIVLIYPSSAAVYGITSKKSIYESDQLNPYSTYGTYKLIGEELCKSYVKNFGFSIIIIRFFSIYGPSLKKQLLWDACNKLMKRNFTFHGSGLEIRDWLHIKDACDLIFKAAQKPCSGLLVVNGSTNKGTNVFSIIKKIFFIFQVEEQPFFTTLIREGDPPYLVGDNEYANEMFKWKPVYDLDKGLLDYCLWFKSLKND